MKRVLLSLLSVMTVSKLTAQLSDMDQLKKLNANFIHNFVMNDAIAHNLIVHKDFICITSEGRTINRKDYLDEWAHGFNGFIYWDYRNENITIIGTTALVRSQNKYIFEKDGKEITGMSMYTDTYVKENGEWKCIQAQLCKVTPQYFAGDETIVRKYDSRK